MARTATLDATRVSAQAYAAALEPVFRSRYGAWLTPWTAAQLRNAGARCYLAHDGAVGGAVTASGELVGLFNLGAPRGSGRAMAAALIDLGARRLDCTGEWLRDLYASLGFRVTQTLPWDDCYAREGWRPEDGRPNIYIMELS